MFYHEDEDELIARYHSGCMRFCHPKDLESISRRQLLRHGVSLSAMMGGSMLLPNWVRAQTASQGPKRLVWIMMNGGWDILEVTDPKVASTSGIDMSYAFTDARQIQGAGFFDRIGRHLPLVASLGSDLLVVRGLAMGTTSHTAGAVYMDTGVLSNSGTVNVASIPAILASQGETTLPMVQLQGGMDVLTDRATNNVSVVRAQNLNLYRAMYPANAAAIEQKLRVLDHLQQSSEALAIATGSNDRLAAIQVAEAKIRLQFQNDVSSKLELNAGDIAPFMAGAPTGMSTQGRDSFAMAFKLLNNDLATSINVGFGGYDTHSNQNATIGNLLGQFDYLVSTLVNQLRSVNQLDNTLIVVVSDFGRTPKINASVGRDHWPVGGALMLGGGIDGGRIVGATDDNLRALSINTTTGLVDASGEQISAKHLGGSVISICLGQEFFTQKRSGYLYSIPALTRLKGS